MLFFIEKICYNFAMEYNKLSNYLKSKFNERTLKICIDANFTCPNRDGTKGYGGCIFCSEKGSGELIKNAKNCDDIDAICDSIENQVNSFLNSYKGKRANKFIVYFQNFTNTYDSIDRLDKRYKSALFDDRIVGISIATRPDMINEGIACLLESYTKKYCVSVELGLQNSSNRIGEYINRCYTTNDFINACETLKKHNIEIVAHLMIGLGETKKELLDTVKLFNLLQINGIKIHSTYVVKNTVLEKKYLCGEYQPLNLDDYINNLEFVLQNLDKNIVVHRLCGDAPKDILVAPMWNEHKTSVLNTIEKRLKDDNIIQGSLYI